MHAQHTPTGGKANASETWAAWMMIVHYLDSPLSVRVRLSVLAAIYGFLIEGKDRGVCSMLQYQCRQH